MNTIVSFLSVGLAVGSIAWSAADAFRGRAANATSSPSITARLVDDRKNASRNAVAVEATVRGLLLVAPDLVSQGHSPIQGHLHYQLDGGAVIATTDTQISFHALPPGDHKITVNLTDGNHVPIGMPVILTVTIPAVETVMAY